MRGCVVHVPANFDAEVLSALGRLYRAGELPAEDVTRDLDQLARAPYERHALAPLLAAAWQQRGTISLLDALYIVLAEKLSAPILTIDRGLAAATTRAELVRL
jgi:predicted nucleic acid-binding protein